MSDGSPARRAPAGPARARAGEGGFTLIEMMVAMLILSVVLVVALESFTNVITSQVRQSSVSNSESQLAQAFIALDTEVRYSEGVDVPDSTGGSYYVEFEYYTPANVAECAELQYAPGSGTLSQRTWVDPGGSSTPSPGAWDVLARGLTTAGQPFSLVTDVAGQTGIPTHMQQLQVSLTASAGKGIGRESSQSTVVFTAVDTTSPKPPATPVCAGVTPS